MLEIKCDAAEKRWAEAARRCEELSRQRTQSESDRAKSDEALAAALHEKRYIESQLTDERISQASAVKREGGLRHQLEAAEWALATSSQQAAALEAERAALAERSARLQTQIDLSMYPKAASAAAAATPGAVARAGQDAYAHSLSKASQDAYYLTKATVRERPKGDSNATTALGRTRPPPLAIPAHGLC